MEEKEVIDYLKKYLTKNGWRLLSTRGGYVFEGFEIVPDIIASNPRGEKLFIEAKGSDFEEFKRGICQVLIYSLYADYVALAVPEDMEKLAKVLLHEFKLIGKGRIGLFVIFKDGVVTIPIPFEKIEIRAKQKVGVSFKLTYFADLTLEELGKILDFAYRHRGEYENVKEFNNLLLQKYQEVTLRPFQKESAKRKMLNNFKITINQLNFWDENRQLNDEGRFFRNLFIHDKEKFKRKIAFKLLTEGNWIGLLGILHEIANYKFTSKKNYYEVLAKTLINKGFQRPTEKLQQLANKMYDRYIRTLKELNLIMEEKNRIIVKWEEVSKILLEFY